MKAKRERIIAWALLILGTVCYVSLIFNHNVWMDEAFTASLVRTDMAGVLARSMNDTLPPLYNIILKLMTDLFGYTIPVMKLTSVIPIILTMVLSATVIYNRFGAMTSYLFTIALTLMPTMQFFGVEIRMYSLGFFFATASGIYAYEVLCESNRKNWILFTLFSVLAGYSHHFAFVTVGAVYFLLLLYYLIADRKHIRRWLLCLLATFLLYLPCLIVTLKQLKSVSGYFSMPEVTLSVFIKYMYYPFVVGFKPLSVLLGLVVAALWIYRFADIVRTRDFAGNKMHIYALLSFLVFYGVLVFGTIISKIMTANIFVDRYLFFAIGLIWLFFAIEAPRLPALPFGKITWGAVFIVFELLIGIVTYRDEYRIEYAEGADEMIAYLEENVSEGDGLLIQSEDEALYQCMNFYQPNFVYYGSDSDAASALKDSKLQCIWLVQNALGDNAYELPDIDGAQAEFIGEFRFDRYAFNLYRYLPR